MNLLKRIVEDKRREIERRRADWPLRELQETAMQSPSPPDFIASLRTKPIGLIAEVKRRSPSAGLIRRKFDPAEIAKAYADGGAQAISVLVDAPYFGGGDDDVRAVRGSVDLPILYKEFVIDPWQIWHARALGASAVLLIVAALEEPLLKELHAVAVQAGLTPLVEVHTPKEFEAALSLGARCIGVNNRNLKTFETTLETSLRLARLAPPGVLLVSESGIGSRRDVLRLREAGFHAVLVGESLLRKRDLVKAVGALMREAWSAA